jgi:hypothetical protein
LILLLQTFNVPLDYFAPPKKSAPSRLQNALARLGASHLRETEGLLPSERLIQAQEVIREVLVAAESARQIAALAPVFVNQGSHLNLNKLKFDLEKTGSLNRLGWLLDNLSEAVKSEAGKGSGRGWGVDYVAALSLLESAANLLLPSFPPPSSSPEEVLEPELLGAGEKTLKEVRASRSKWSKKWRILTRIQPADFIHALRESRGAD